MAAQYVGDGVVLVPKYEARDVESFPTPRGPIVDVQEQMPARSWTGSGEDGDVGSDTYRTQRDEETGDEELAKTQLDVDDTDDEADSSEVRNSEVRNEDICDVEVEWGPGVCAESVVHAPRMDWYPANADVRDVNRVPCADRLDATRQGSTPSINRVGFQR